MKIPKGGWKFFLSHTWNKDELGRDTHGRVKVLKKALDDAGISSWIDEEQMPVYKNIDEAMTAGIDNSEYVLVFITGAYIEKVNGEGENGANDNCKKEFTYAVNRKGAKKVIVIVMEDKCKNTKEWKGPVGLYLGSNLYYVYTKDDKDAVKEVVDDLKKLLETSGKPVPKHQQKTPASIPTVIPPKKPSEPVRFPSVHSDGVYSVAIDPIGKWVASGSWDNSIAIYSIATRGVLDRLREHTSWVFDVAFSSDGRQLASASRDKTIRLWSIDKGGNGKLFKTLRGHTNTVHSVCYGSDDDTLVSGSCDHTIRVWDLSTGVWILGPSHQVLKGHTYYVWSVSMSPNGRQIVSGSSDKTVRVWNTHNGNEVVALNDHSDSVNSVCWSGDGTMMASSSLDKTIIVWDATSFQKIKTLTGHRGYVVSVCFNHDSTMLASGSHDNTVIVWDVHHGTPLETFTMHTNYVTSVDFHPTEDQLVSGSYDKSVILYDVSHLRSKIGA